MIVNLNTSVDVNKQIRIAQKLTTPTSETHLPKQS